MLTVNEVQAPPQTYTADEMEKTAPPGIYVHHTGYDGDYLIVLTKDAGQTIPGVGIASIAARALVTFYPEYNIIVPGTPYYGRWKRVKAAINLEIQEIE